MRIVVGTMTGTSMDAIDAVAVEIVGHGLAMPNRVSSTTVAYIGGG